jgi:hypothetical protein
MLSLGGDIELQASLVGPKFGKYRSRFCPVGAALLIFFMAPCHVLGIEPNVVNKVTALISEYRNQFKEGTAIDRGKDVEAAQVSALVAIIDGESKPRGDRPLKHRALRELERFPNSEEAITILLREIQFEPPQRYSKNPLATYTAASVLSKMGGLARTRVLKSGLNKPLADPELYLRGVVVVMLDDDQGEWKLAKEIALKRVKHLIETVEREAGAGEAAEHRAAILFNLKRMTSLIEDPTFSARRIPDPAEPPK